MQGLVGAIFEGVGVSSGSFIGGYMMKHFGGSFTFRMFGIAALLLCAVHVIVQKLVVKCACTSGKKVNGERVGVEGDDTPQNEQFGGETVLTETYKPLSQQTNKI